MNQPNVIKIKPSHKSQGDYVLINESDFDAKLHELFESEGAKKAPTVAEIKDALAAKGIDIPEGVTKRDDLKALLDAASE